MSENELKCSYLRFGHNVVREMNKKTRRVYASS